LFSADIDMCMLLQINIASNINTIFPSIKITTTRVKIYLLFIASHHIARTSNIKLRWNNNNNNNWNNNLFIYPWKLYKSNKKLYVCVCVDLIVFTFIKFNTQQKDTCCTYIFHIMWVKYEKHNMNQQIYVFIPST
jgi:hypothetical protein